MTFIREAFANCIAALGAVQLAWTDREVFSETRGRLVATIILDHDASSPRRQKTARTKTGFAAPLIMERHDLHGLGGEAGADANFSLLDARLQAVRRAIEWMLTRRHS